jgi:hypothetical protein
MKRSAIAFARGARAGVLMIRTSMAVKTPSNAAVLDVLIPLGAAVARPQRPRPRPNEASPRTAEVVVAW